MDNIVLIRVKRPPQDKLIFFQLANLFFFFSIFSTITSQIAFNLKEAPRGSLENFKGKEEILQLRMLARSS